MSHLRVLHPWPVQICNASKPVCYRCLIRPSDSKLSVKTRRLFSSTHGLTPRAVQPSTWQSIIPRAFRENKTQVYPTKHDKQQRDWNPATFFIFIFLLIGSNAIQLISLRHDILNFSRKSEAKIGLLKEVIERVQRGEKVDVEGLLGTGSEEQEREWEEVIREIEDADRHWDPLTRKRKDRQASRNKEEQPFVSKHGGGTVGPESAEFKRDGTSVKTVTSESIRRGFY